MDRTLAASVLAATTLAAGACAAVPGSSGGACRSSLRSHPASLDAVIDSTALQTEVDRMFVEPLGLVLAQIRYDSVGALESARVLSDWMPEAGEEALGMFVRERATPVAAPDATEHVFLIDRSSRRVRRLDAVASCTPVMRDRGTIGRRLESQARALELAEPRSVLLYMFVATDGSVSEVQVERGSGLAAVDVAAAQVLRTATFEPARIEGIAVPVWVSVPLTLRAGSGGGRIDAWLP